MANQSQETQSSRIFNQSANVSDLDISLHPLPILNVSDHFTRTQLQAERQDIAIFGALIGTQIGKKIEIVNCFEILTDPDGKVNDGFLKTRREQFQQVFPTLDLLGWYTNGFQPREKDLTIFNQVSECADLSSPIVLFYDPLPTLSTGSTTAKELPIHIYEFTQSTAGTDGEAFFKCTFDVQTSEAERIAVDSVAKPDVGSKEGGRSYSGLIAPIQPGRYSCLFFPRIFALSSSFFVVVANLVTQRNAIQMLHNKLGLIVDYLAQLMGNLEAGNSATKIDHGLLREISSLVASMPKPDENASFKKEFMIESNDALLTSYLSSQSKVLTETNQLIDRYLYLNTRDITQSKTGPQSVSGHNITKSLKMQK